MHGSMRRVAAENEMRPKFHLHLDSRRSVRNSRGFRHLLFVERPDFSSGSPSPRALAAARRQQARHDWDLDAQRLRPMMNL